MRQGPEKTFLVEDAQLIFKNFAGKETQFNAEGRRNFCVILDDDTAERMHSDGWNVKTLEGREEGEPDIPYIQVAVSYKNKPPMITMISSGGRTILTGDTVEILDWVDMAKVDLFCRAYEWEVGSKTGIKAYLKTMFVTINEDPLEQKYAQMAQSAGEDD